MIKFLWTALGLGGGRELFYGNPRSVMELSLSYSPLEGIEGFSTRHHTDQHITGGEKHNLFLPWFASRGRHCERTRGLNSRDERPWHWLVDSCHETNMKMMPPRGVLLNHEMQYCPESFLSIRLLSGKTLRRVLELPSKSYREAHKSGLPSKPGHDPGLQMELPTGVSQTNPFAYFLSITWHFGREYSVLTKNANSCRSQGLFLALVNTHSGLKLLPSSRGV